MKKLNCFLALLLVLLLGGLLSARYMGQHHREISRQLDSSAWLALSGEFANARVEADAARVQWEKGRPLRAVLGDHTPMEEIDDLFAELHIYGAAGETVEFARICNALSSRVAAMGMAHQLSWWNVL